MRIVRALLATVVLAAVSVADLDAQLRLREIASGFASPLAFVPDPLNRDIQFVVQQNGRIRVVRNAAVQAADFIDLSAAVISGGEQGLLGLAFTPDTAASGRFFVNFTNRQGHTVVARFRRSDPVTADAGSRFDLRWGGTTAFIAQPFANHNGGHLAFGPDGFLYIGLGDGGSGNDPDHRAQNPAELLGKMLRIDVNVPDSHPNGYQIPSGNPFAAGPRPEVWAFGLRNPWRYSLDDPARGGTGGWLIADVGQNRFEEVSYEPPNRPGRNYGWRNREGAHDNVTSRPAAFLPLVDPIHEYDHNTGISITGGYVYRGGALPASFRGRYFFADLTGRLWSIALTIEPGTQEARASDLIEHTAELGGTSQLGNISSFGIDADGEIYVVSYSRGRVFRIIGPATAPPAPSGLRIIRS